MSGYLLSPFSSVFTSFIHGCFSTQLWLKIVTLLLSVIIVTTALGSEPVGKTLKIQSPQSLGIGSFGANDKLSETLRWDNKTLSLSAYVTYSKVSGSEETDMDPGDYVTYELDFPNVCVDPTGRLYVLGDKNEKVFFGHLERWLFGPKVLLDKNVRFYSAYKKGILSAEIIVNTGQCSQ